MPRRVPNKDVPHRHNKPNRKGHCIDESDDRKCHLFYLCVMYEQCLTEKRERK